VPARIESGKAVTALGRFPAAGFAEGAAAIVCVRQRGVRLLPAAEGIPARVLHQRFLGDNALVELAVQDLDAPILARVRESDAPSPGTELGVGVDASSVLVFPAE
jgi:iron(III) transport system ATP-binding protein